MAGMQLELGHVCTTFASIPVEAPACNLNRFTLLPFCPVITFVSSSLFPYLQKRPGSIGARHIPGLVHSEGWCRNTTMETLVSSPSWQLLLGRIGDVLLSHLLVHTSLFVPLGAGNYLQVRGAG
jgi:hypothetical protein